MEQKELPPKQTLKAYLTHLLDQACFQAFEDLPKDFSVEVTLATQEQFGHYQCNSAMKLAKILRQSPREIATKICERLDRDCFSQVEIAGAGFINMTLSCHFLIACFQQCVDDPALGIPKVEHPQTVIVEFSSPNIAKQMHVGHLRCTIIGDAIARLFEFLGHDVIRLNHLGDWGTAFGMLIAYLKRHQQAVLEGKKEADLETLMHWYKESKKLFDENESFKTEARNQVVALQSGDLEALKAWELICHISRLDFEKIYSILDVKLNERGESYYNLYLPKIVKDLEDKGLITVSEGAKCVFHEEFKIPLMVQKSDGGYNYDTTDMAAMWHRVFEEKANRIIVLTDVGQKLHFDLIEKTCLKAGYLDPSKVRFDHVTFGLVLDQNKKKFKTRSGETVKLIDLLETAVEQAKVKLAEKREDLKESELEKTAHILGIDAVKYGDLSCNRVQDYVFSYEKMLRFEGNTAAFILYAYVRSLSIQNKTEKKPNAAKLTLEKDSELTLAVWLLRFHDVLEGYAEDLMPHTLTEYLYQLASRFNLFFRDCHVIGSENEQGRLYLCELTSKTLKLGLELLGLKTLNRM